MPERLSLRRKGCLSFQYYIYSCIIYIVFSCFVQYCHHIQVVIVSGFHLFPFRTEKLSPSAPMVLHTRGRVGCRRFSREETLLEIAGSLCFCLSSLGQGCLQGGLVLGFLAWLAFLVFLDILAFLAYLVLGNPRHFLGYPRLSKLIYFA